MNKDIYDAVQQVVKDLILPELAKLHADIAQLKEQQSIRPPPPRTDAARPAPPPQSPESRAYIDAICAEISERAEREAAAWARRKAKDPNAKASALGQQNVKT